MMKSILFGLVATMCLTTTPPAEAQQFGKIFRIGFLDASTAAGSAVLVEEFRQELSRLGWIEGKNITIEFRFAEQKSERQPKLAADLVRIKADLIVVSGTPAALAAKRATTTIPIVIASAGDPVAGPTGRQCHRKREFRHRAKHQTTGDTSGCGSQARPSWTSAVAGPKHITPDERPQACGSGAKVKTGRDRDSNRRQRIGERLSNRKAEADWRDHDDLQSALFRRKKTDRRTCGPTPVDGYLSTG